MRLLGDIELRERAVRLADRFWSKVDKDGPVHPVLGTPCWLWNAGCNAGGYGQIHVCRDENRRQVVARAHRVAYLLLRGSIPGGLDLDHLCRVRRCVNPDHLEPVTNRENTHRGDGPSGRAFRATHCPKGHPYVEGNIYWHRRPSGARDRDSRECSRRRESERRCSL